MKNTVDAAFIVDDDYFLEGVATAYMKLGLSCIWWEPSKKPYFDLLDEMNPRVVYYTSRGVKDNNIYLRDANKHLNMRNVNDDYSGLLVNDLLYRPGQYDKFLESDGLMIIKGSVPESQFKDLFKLCGTMPGLKIIGKKYMPIVNHLGRCTLDEIRDAIASTRTIIDYDNTFAAVAYYYGINCMNLQGDLLWGKADGTKPTTFLEAVKQHVSNSSQQNQ